MSDRKVCFVIAPIGDPDSETRKRSDQILKHVIAPAVNECGYNPVRADKLSEPGLITSQVIQHILKDPLVIADLTDRNPNVFYELAVRHVIKKPLVQLIKKGEQIPFDVAATRTIYVDHHDLDSVEEAKKEIIKQIKAVESDPSKIDTPISVSLDLQQLRQSDNPEQRSLADLISVTSELRTSIARIEEKIGEPESSTLFGSSDLSNLVKGIDSKLNEISLINELLVEKTEGIEKMLGACTSEKKEEDGLPEIEEIPF